MPAQYSKDQGHQWTQPTVIAEITQASDHPLRTQWRAIERNPYKNRWLIHQLSLNVLKANIKCPNGRDATGKKAQQCSIRFILKSSDQGHLILGRN
jgi:hypothetical protein